MRTHYASTSNSFEDINALLARNDGMSLTTKFCTKKKMMVLALVQCFITKTWAFALGILHRKQFYCITNSLEHIGIRNPNRLRRRI